MEDSKSKKGGPQGVGVPAKGDSSAGNSPFDPSDGATISDVPLVPPPPPIKPPTKVVNPDATISDSLPAISTPSGARALSGIYMTEMVLQPGDLIGARYEILQLLGEGGM